MSSLGLSIMAIVQKTKILSLLSLDSLLLPMLLCFFVSAEFMIVAANT
jgi:hypothetical protein